MSQNRRGLLGGLLAGAVACAVVLMPKAGQTQSLAYTYDALGRLTSVTYPGGIVTTYTYDAAGNRTQLTSGPPAPPPALAAAVSGTFFEGGLSADAGTAVVTANGGVAPYAYLWERLSGVATTVAYYPASNQGIWYYTGTAIGPPKVTTWRCRVTDGASTVVYTPTVTVRILMS